MTPLETSDTARSPADAVPLRERWIAGLLLVAAFALRVFYIFRYRYDSDEPQHLHTTWGWTQGLLQYRDFFDNHTPLFHMLFSPLVAALGERTNILTFMRFAMVPLWFVSLWCVWKIGSRLFSRRVGLWAVVFISLLPWWAFCAIEYRTDNLWTPLWLGAMAVLLTGRLNRWRTFAAGVLLGLCFMVSMKTSVLFGVCVLAAAATPLVFARRFAFGKWVHVLAIAWPAVLGSLIAPAVICGFFYEQGAWEQFKYGVIGHNLLPNVDARNHPKLLRLIFPITLPILLWISVQIGRRAPDTATAQRRMFLFLVVGFYKTALYSFWTLLTRQDELPYYPLAMVLLAALLVWLIESLPVMAEATANTHPLWLQGGWQVFGRCLRRFAVFVPTPGQASLRMPRILGAVAVLEIVLMLGGRPPWKNETVREQEILGEVLTLTKPGEYVMDFKGECVFRPRAYFYVFEPLTVVRLKTGKLPDTVAQDVVDQRVCVVLNQSRFYLKDTVAFLAVNYLPVGRTRIAGQVIGGKASPKGQPIKFEIRVPVSYVAWADDHVVSGTLDGSPWTKARELAAGPHEFIPDEKHSQIYVLWSRAADLGFKPLTDQPGWQYFR